MGIMHLLYHIKDKIFVPFWLKRSSNPHRDYSLKMKAKKKISTMTDQAKLMKISKNATAWEVGLTAEDRIKELHREAE